MVVPFAPGGAVDTLGRLVAAQLTDVLGQNVVVENKPGAGGNIGSNYVAKAAPDGYTLLFGAAGNIAINPSLFSNMPFDVARDLAPAALVSQSMNVLVVPAALPVNSVAELVQYAKAHPSEVNFGSSGNGGTTHLAGELFNAMAGTHITHVPYQGSGPAMVDLLAGRVQLMFDNLPSAMPYIRRGDLKALGATGPARSPQLPDTPTIAQTGLADYEATTWFGVFAPAGTPQAVLDKINTAVNQTMQAPAIDQRLQPLGTYFQPASRAQFQALIEADTRKWAKVIKNAGIRLN
nr:tripartite tricarboxylate transporter substrate binding protein [Bordetella holmesii]